MCGSLVEFGNISLKLEGTLDVVVEKRKRGGCGREGLRLWNCSKI